MSESVKKYKFAVLASGSGTTLQNLIDLQNAGRLAHGMGAIAIVIASRGDAYAIERAKKASIESKVITRKSFADVAAFSDAVFAACEAAGVDLILMAGWLCLVKVPKNWSGKVLNIHPSLLPAFGGKGMYGLHVHQAVLASGVKESGCTVHGVTDEYDAGPVLVQLRCEVRPGDTPETLAARVFDLEKKAYPQAIEMMVSRLSKKGL